MKINIKNEEKMKEYIQREKATYIMCDVYEEWIDNLKTFAESLLKNEKAFNSKNVEYAKLKMDNYWDEEEYSFIVSFEKTIGNSISIDLVYDPNLYHRLDENFKED